MCPSAPYNTTPSCACSIRALNCFPVKGVDDSAFFFISTVLSVILTHHVFGKIAICFWKNEFMKAVSSFQRTQHPFTQKAFNAKYQHRNSNLNNEVESRTRFCLECFTNDSFPQLYQYNYRRKHQ